MARERTEHPGGSMTKSACFQKHLDSTNSALILACQDFPLQIARWVVRMVQIFGLDTDNALDSEGIG